MRCESHSATNNSSLDGMGNTILLYSTDLPQTAYGDSETFRGFRKQRQGGEWVRDHIPFWKIFLTKYVKIMPGGDLCRALVDILRANCLQVRQWGPCSFYPCSSGRGRNSVDAQRSVGSKEWGTSWRFLVPFVPGTSAEAAAICTFTKL